MSRKRFLLIGAVVLATLLFQGCWVYSAYPLAETEADQVFDRNLLATWAQEEGCTLAISRVGEDRNYHVFYAAPREQKSGGCLLDEGQSASFLGSLVELNGVRFLDLYPADREDTHHSMALHSFYKIAVSGRTLTIMPVNRDWLKEQMDSGLLPIAARLRTGGEGDDLVLTSPTRELRSYLESNASNDSLFPQAKKIVFQRKPPS